MPIARFQLPDGRIARFEVPAGTTPEQAQTLIGQHIQATGVPSAPAAPAEDPAARESRIAAATAQMQEEDRQRYDPTIGMSGTEKFLAGAGKAVSDTVRGAGQLVGRVGDAVTTPQKSITDLVTGGQGKRWSERMGLPQEADIAETRANDAALMDTGAGFAGNIAGNVATLLTPGAALKGAATANAAVGAARAGNNLRAVLAAAPRAGSVLERAGQAMIAPTTLRGAATLGAVSGAAQPVVSDSERGWNALLGGGAAAGGQALFNGLARIVRPNTSAEVRTLMDEGVTPTPGQVLGGAARRIEEGLTSLPIVGDAIRAGQTRAIEDLNRVAFNRALSPIGLKLPKGLKGREAVSYVADALSDRYDQLMPRLTTMADGGFIQDIQQLRNMMGSGAVAQETADRFEKILNNQLLVKFSGQNTAMTGKTLKEVESDLGNTWRDLRQSSSSDDRKLGDAVRQTQDVLRQLVERSNPHVADELRAINKGYANFSRPERAAASVAAEDGVFSPAQLHSAVKATDKSRNKKAFARGDALMQDLSDPAKAALSQKVPDSGTPLRLMTGAGAAGLLAMVEPTALAGTLGASALYSRPGQSALATLLARRPASADAVANRLRELAPYAAAPAIGYSEQ